MHSIGETTVEPSGDLPQDVAASSRGEEFRDDLRELPAAAPSIAAKTIGAGNAAARRWLTSAELASLTELSAARSLLAIGQTSLLIAVAIAITVSTWPSAWAALGVVLVGIAQHGLFILAHESAHYRLFAHRGLNDVVGRAIGMAGGISMCTYRVTHRLHHNNLYTAEDPDTAIHGGYPRGRAYLARKLARDLAGLNAHKTFAYFFGSPALNEDAGRDLRPLDDTSPQLRRAARIDRLCVVAFQIGAPIAAYALGGGRGLGFYALLWMLPLVTVLQPILRLRAICEHGGVTDLSSPLTAARSNRTWGTPLNWLARAVVFPHHVNYHLEHHLYPAVPHYRLPALHRLLEAKGALAGAEVRNVADTVRVIFAPRRPRSV